MDGLQILKDGNRYYMTHGNRALRQQTATHGQHPHTVVICCSDSRVIPEQIFHADIGDLFVIRVAGNVLGRHQLGSIEYAVEHLGCKTVVMLGHTGCGAVGAAIEGHTGGCVAWITDDILEAIGMERDPLAACRLNVRYGVDRIRTELTHLPAMADVTVHGAVYDIQTGEVEFID